MSLRRCAKREVSLTTDQDQHKARSAHYSYPITEGLTMTQQTKMVFCKDRMVHVDLQQGFHQCIVENQCFSDEPCPLDGQFDQPPVQAQLATPSESVATD